MSTEVKPSSRAGSKTNLNESSVPLLLVEEEHRVVHKNPEGKESGGEDVKGSAETFELKEKIDETAAEANGKEFRNGDTKKPRKEGKTHRRQPSFLDEMTVGLNLLDRDDRKINEPVNLAFGDVIAEPDASHGIDMPWKWSFVAFTFVKTWIYRILAALVGIPLAILWGFIFSLITFVYIWILTPFLRVVDLGFGFVRRLVLAFTRTFIEPPFAAVGALMSQIRIRRESMSVSTTTSGHRGQQTDEDDAESKFHDVEMA